MTDFLEQVIAERRADAAALDANSRDVAGAPAVRSLFAALSARRASGMVALIAEVKRRSPSVGAFPDIPDVAARARLYEEAGAAAVSVLAEPRHWGGSLDDVRRVREAVSVPVLYKDVVVDDRQIEAARKAGADAILLIAEALDDGLLARLDVRARSLGMETLIEAHELEHFERVLRLETPIVGVNARNLRDPARGTDKAVIHMAAAFMPSNDRILVSESGIETEGDVRGLPERVDAVLVGTVFVRRVDPSETVRRLATVSRSLRQPA